MTDLPAWEKAMARHLKVASAQLGPIHLSDDRQAVVRRLCDMLREAHVAAFADLFRRCK